jgi:hypothetical protein
MPEDWNRTRDAICPVEEDSDRVEEWACAVECGSWDAITALTIWQLPNLEELTFERWEISNSFYPFVVGFLYRVRPLDHLKPCLQSLKIIDHSKLPRYYLPNWVERPCVSLEDIQFGFDLVRHKEKCAPALKCLNLGWMRTQYPDRSRFQPGTVCLSQHYPGADGQNACGV